LACADSPPWAIVQQAETRGIDLVVVGAHSHSALQRLFLGSVALKAVVEAPCSVRIARRPQPGHDRLRGIVAVDGSEDSVSAVRAVAARPWPANCQWRVITILEPKLQTAAVWPGVYPASWGLAKAQGAEEWAGRMTEHLADMLRPGGGHVEAEVYDGDPKRVLLDQAEDWKADCIFLGARGLHHGNRVYLGSLACAVASRAPCSVEIVRERGSARPGQPRPSHDEIARRAYELWEGRGRPSGREVELWLEAERGLRGGG
jgi:nucleotide-binding universal stress UspA family protein